MNSTQAIEIMDIPTNNTHQVVWNSHGGFFTAVGDTITMHVLLQVLQSSSAVVDAAIKQIA